MSTIKDLTILGSGPCGIYAAFCAGLRNMSGYLLEIKDEFGGQPLMLYRHKNVYDFPGVKEATGQQIVDMLWEQYLPQSKKIIPKSNAVISHIIEKKDYFQLLFVDGLKIDTKNILIATGNGAMLPRTLNLENEEHYLNIDYFVKDIEKYRDKKIVFLGGGDSAVDWANHFLENNITDDVSIVHRRRVFRAKENNVDNLLTNGIKVYKNYTIEKLIGEENKCFQILIKNNDSLLDKLLSVDYLIVQYGLTNSYGIISTIPGLQWNKGKILVNSGQHSSKKGIFAVGNSCYYEGKDYILSSSIGESATAITNIYKRNNPNHKGIFYSSSVLNKK